MKLFEIVRSPSKMLTWILGFFCLGILVGPFFLSFSNLIFLGVAGGTFLFSFWLSGEQKLLLLAVACLAFGVFRYQQSFLPDAVTTVQDKIGISVRVEGIISADIERRVGIQQTILSHVSVADESVSGKILVRFPLFPKLSYKDRVVFSCLLKKPEPFQGFAYDRQLAARGVMAVCSFPEFVSVISHQPGGLVGSILWGRDALVARLHAVIPEPHASFVAGLLFGGSSSLSSDVRDDFSRTGLSHILAASGFNVSLFSLYLLHLLLQSPLGRRRGLIVTSLLLLVYLFAAGATPAVVRATVMAGMLVLQKAIGRRASLRNAFLFALTFMLLLNPRLLLDDVGFQLSFVATAALVFVLPRFESWFEFISEFAGVRTAVASSSVAIVCTLPILFWHFGELSLVAPLANALVLPFVPLLMVLGVIGMIGGSFVALPAYGLSFMILRLTQVLSSLPFASVSIIYAHLISLLILGVFIVIFIYDRFYGVTSSRSAT